MPVFMIIIDTLAQNNFHSTHIFVCLGNNSGSPNVNLVRFVNQIRYYNYSLMWQARQEQ
jgi:hypothetical protein